MTESVLELGAAHDDAPSRSAVSWPAVIAGAVVASAFSLALLTLGAGIGLVSVSPWSSNNPSVVTFGILAAAWLIAVQLFASGVGGYIAGRLRVGWVGAHTDEVYFRDTAHGLLVWALGAVISVSLIAFAASSIVSDVTHAGASAMQAAGAVASSASARQPGRPSADAGGQTDYFTDMLFRADHPAAGADAPTAPSEARRIFAMSASSGDMSDADKTYLAQLVAAKTGLSQADAEKRVSDVLAQAKGARDKAVDAVKTAADAARKTGVYVAIWAFISLLVGAFSASYMATVGARERDERPALG
jgi:vacuolar-type H+-ATPase subunit I/STV1